MSIIDVENAKQIRDPMDVLIKMEVPEEVNLTYSGYASSSKVADAVLDERGWPMRILADLQGNGFQLDGSCQLYDPTVTPSATNGKIGVRGNIGQRLSITVTGDTIINGLSIVASGTDAVHFNGQTAALSGGQVIIPVGASSITIEFDPLTSDTRAEVSTAMAGTSIQVTNDSIISCVVSLRSDLSIDNPTLPESEINIDIYNDVDISEVVASIPDDTPITYSAGYVGDMSQERNFYVSGQVTWADNVLTIHGVDAVHFLDKEVNSRSATYNGGFAFSTTPSFVTAMLAYAIKECGVEFSSGVRGYYQGVSPEYLAGKGNSEAAVWERQSCRDLLSFAMNVLRIKDIPNDATPSITTPGTHNFLLTYVDAGRPTLRTDIVGSPWAINESDCGDIKRSIDVICSSINVQHKRVSYSRSDKNYAEAGSIEVYKNNAGFISIDTPIIDSMQFGIFARDIDSARAPYMIYPLAPPTVAGRVIRATPQDNSVQLTIIGRTSPSRYSAGRVMFDEGTRQDSLNAGDVDNSVIYTQIIPWNTVFDPVGTVFTFIRKNGTFIPIRSFSDLFSAFSGNDVIDPSADSLSLTVFGHVCNFGEETRTYSNGASQGQAVDIEEKIHGRVAIANSSSVELGEIFPQMAYESLLDRSNITGSFTWKGDPRMQPRDVVNFHRLDGTVEEITLENITIHHEGGGTYAEITYRKGIC